jgi:hypothetical protein
VPLDFPGHKDYDALMTEPRFRFRKATGRPGAKVMATRPMIPTGWRAEIPVTLDVQDMNVETLEDIARRAGRQVGLCDWRPSSPKVPGTFGQFVVTKFTVHRG